MILFFEIRWQVLMRPIQTVDDLSQVATLTPEAAIVENWAASHYRHQAGIRCYPAELPLRAKRGPLMNYNT